MLGEIVLAAGCFWGVEKHFESLEGVVDVKSGYVGGNYEDPTYKKVLKYRWLRPDQKNIINHTEAVLIKFDKNKTDVKEILKSFWQIHDPTQLNRQGNDIGNNYRSAIFYTNEKQKNLAFDTKQTYQTLLTQNGFGKIVTQISPLEKFYEAENYHQDYLKKNPNGYCPNHSTGVKFQELKTNKNYKNIEQLTPIKGKEILIVTSNQFCPYCEKIENEIVKTYKADIPLNLTFKEQLSKYNITTDLFATPTILFIENGIEVFSYRGYLDEKSFYKLLGEFKLGKNSLAYDIAFNQDTENRFCAQYEIFKDTPDGYFVDIVSNEKLFDTKDRFNSKSGWLSFYKAIDNTTVEKIDYSHGMVRTEVIAKKSGIHLGHVFQRPDGKRRFCINANVLKFIPKTQKEKEK